MPPVLQGTSMTAAANWTEQPAGTTSSSIATGHPSRQIGKLKLVEPVVQDRVSSAFEKALTSGREAEWESFVDRVSALVDRLTEAEFYALARLTLTVGSNYRPAAALARVLSAYVASERWQDHAASALGSLLRHKSPEVRLQVLEAAVDAASPEVARSLATLARMDPHEAVRNLSRDISDR
jgi:hypothetical protein